MKMSKNLLFGLAGFWTVLFIIDKVFKTVGLITIKRKSIFQKSGFYLSHFIRSVLLTGIAIFNIFMAISLLEDRRNKY